MSKARKIIICALALLLLSALAVPLTISAIYRSKTEQQLALLKAEGGSRNILDLVPKPLGNRGTEPLRLLSANGFIPSMLRGSSSALSDFSSPKVSDDLKVFAAFNQFMQRSPTRFDKALLAEKGAPFDDAWLPWLDKLTTDDRVYLDCVRKTAFEGNAMFNVDWTQGANTLLPHLCRVQEIAWRLRIDAYVRMHKGDVTGAMEDVRASLRLRGLIDTDPVVVSRLVAYATDSIALVTLAGVVGEGRPDRASVEAVLVELSGREERNRATNAIAGEIAMGLNAFEMVARDPQVYFALRRSGTGGMPTPATTEAKIARYMRDTAFRATWLRRADEYNYIVEMRALLARSRMPVAEALSPSSSPAAPQSTLDSMRRLTDLIAPAVAGVFPAEARADLNVAKARLMLALYLYKVDNGAWPASLDALVPRYLPQLPVSPYDGKPLQCRFTADAYVIEAADELDAAKKNSQ